MFNKEILWNLSYGVYIVSVCDKDKVTGCIANSIMQITHNKIAISLNKENYTNQIIKESGTFAVSILSMTPDKNIISTFGFTTGRTKEKFENFEYEIINNLPIVKNSTGYLTLKVTDSMDVDTHTIFISEITGGDIFNQDIPMTYKYYHETIKGKTPKAAPTYMEVDNKEKSGPDTTSSAPKAKKYRCKICGYIYEGDLRKEAPNYKCPVCKQPKTCFEEIAYV